MHEKKTSNGVIRIRMNTCTILALIILPFLLFMLYVILFSECSDLLRKSGARVVSPKFDHLQRNETDEKPTDPDENHVAVNIFDELGVNDKNNPLALINKVQFKENEDHPVGSPLQIGSRDSSEESVEQIPFIFSIIRIIVLPDYSDLPSESDENQQREEDGKKLYGKTDESKSDWGYPYVGLNIPIEPVTEKVVPSVTDMENIIPSPNETETGSTNNEEVEYYITPTLSVEQVEKKVSDETKTSEEPVVMSPFVKDLPAKILPSDSKKVTLAGGKEDYSPELHYVFYEYLDFSIPNIYICPEEGKNLSLLVGIHSDIENFEQRKAIRETWAKVAGMDGLSYAFIVGVGVSDSLDNKIKHESDEYQDLIQVDILARHKYRDANPVMFLKWVSNFCPQVKYVIKADDNVFLNLPQIVKFIKSDDVRDDAMYGDIIDDETPERNPEKENYVSKELFADEMYPEFLNRVAYLFPGKFAPLLYEEAKNVPYFPEENVLITGIIAKKLNITHEDASPYFAEYPDVEEQLEKCSFLKYAVVYPVTPEQMRGLWDEIKSTDYKCYDFLKNMLETIDASKGSENVYDEQVKLFNMLNDKFSPKNKKYEDILA